MTALLGVVFSVLGLVAVVAAARRALGALRRRRERRARLAAAADDAQRVLLVHATLEERARIARELHDVVAHHISMIAVQSEAARLLVADLPADGQRRLVEIGDTARAALTEMRRLLGVLRDDSDDTGSRDGSGDRAVASGTRPGAGGLRGAAGRAGDRAMPAGAATSRDHRDGADHAAVVGATGHDDLSGPGGVAGTESPGNAGDGESTGRTGQVGGDRGASVDRRDGDQVGGTARMATVAADRQQPDRLERTNGGAPVRSSRRPQPGLRQLAELVDEARAHTGSTLRLIVRGPVAPLDPGVELTAYRIVQEALTNVRRHAPGAAIDVELDYRPDALRLRIRDDGLGATAGAGPANGDGQGHGPGHGLTGMRERTAMLGGDIAVGQLEAGGFAVAVTLPREPVP